MKKITSKIFLMLVLSTTTYSLTAQEIVATGAFSELNTSATGQTEIFKTPSSSITDDNFTNVFSGDPAVNPVFPNMFDTSTNSVPRLAQVLVPVNEGYKFEVSPTYKPIAATEVRFQLANGTSNKGSNSAGEAVPSQWKVQGSNDDANWDDLSDPVAMFSGNSGVGVRTPITLTTTKAYRYYRFVLAEAWQPNSKFTALQHLEWTVDATLSVSNNEALANAISVYPNPANSILNIKFNANMTIKRTAIVDVTGKEIFNQTNAQPIDVRNFSKGLYILQVESQDGAVTSKKVMVN